MTRWLVAFCSLGLVLGCDDEDSPGGGAGGRGGAGNLDGGGGGSPGAGGLPGAGGSQAGGSGAGGSQGGGGSPGAGGAGGTSGDGPGPDVGMMTNSAMIPAAAGGTLSAGMGSLFVPAGALDADKMLTVSISAPAAGEPGAADIVGMVYDFGPTGTTFKVPVALTLPLVGTVPADKKVVVVWQEPGSGQWIPLPTTVSGDKVIGQTTHFTRFAAMLLAKDAICPFGSPCGGSLVGTWKYTSSCIKPTEQKAFDCGAAGAVYLRNEYLVGGTATFTADRYTVNHSIVATGTLFYHAACMTVLREMMPNATCATLQEAWRMQGSQPNANWVCSGTVEQGCSCVITNSVTPAPVMGSYVISGSKVTFTQDGKEANPNDFCVNGANASFRDKDGAVTTAVKQ